MLSVYVSYYSPDRSKLYDESIIRNRFLVIPYRQLTKNAINYIETTICRDNALSSISIVNVITLKSDAPKYRKDFLSTAPSDMIARFIVDIAKYSDMKQASVASRNVCRIIKSCKNRGEAVNAIINWLESEASLYESTF